MGLFENFPYTNFHNLNLDWIIKILKNAVAELEEIQTNWEGVRDTANTAKTTADAAAVKAENARTAANGAITKADSAETKAKNADANAELAVVQSSAAQDTATSAEAAANEAKETSARAENTASAAKTAADGANEKATTADSKVDTLATTVNNVGKTASDALSLAQTNETDIASNDADIAEIRKFVTAPIENLMQFGGYLVIAAGDTNYSIPDGAESYTQLITTTISNDTVRILAELENATDGDGHAIYRVNYVPHVWLTVNDTRVYIPAIATRADRNTLTIAATSNIAYATTDGGLHYTLAVVSDLVGINQYTNTPT